MYTHAAVAMDRAAVAEDATEATETADAEIMTMKADAAVVTRVVAAVINSL